MRVCDVVNVVDETRWQTQSTRGPLASPCACQNVERSGHGKPKANARESEEKYNNKKMLHDDDDDDDVVHLQCFQRSVKLICSVYYGMNKKINRTR